MGIIDKIESFVNETKEMSLKKVEKKIKDGYWEAEQDLKVGKHITLRDTKTNKRIVVYITEDLDESVESAAKEIFNALFHKSITKSQDINNFISTVLKNHNVKSTEKSKVIALVKKKGYTGDLLKEDLDESKASLIVSAVKRDLGLSEREFKIAHLTGNIELPKNNDKCVIVFKANNKPKFKVYTFDSSNKWVPGEVFTDSNKLKSLWKDFPNVDYNLNEEEEDSLKFIFEADKMPLTLKIGDSFKTDEGSIKITDITVSSLHMNPVTYITYKYDVVIDGKPLRGEEKASLNSFKDHFKK